MPTLNAKLDVQHKTFINGAELNELQDQQLFDMIRSREEEIADLEKLKHQPQKLHARVAELTSEIEVIVALIDGR